MPRQAEAEAVTATAVATATVIANATATARTAEFYNWIFIWISRGMLADMLLHMAVRLLCRDNYLTAFADRFLVVSREAS